MKIVLICGRKQSGKTTLATALHGYHLTSKGIIPNANIDENGDMTIVYDKKDNIGINFDLACNEEWFTTFCRDNVWRHIKRYSFATELKETAINLFGLDRKMVYGSNEDKEQSTHLLYKDIKCLLPADFKRKSRKKYISYREFLEMFGTAVCRQIDDLCHIRSTFNAIERDQPEIAVIDDGRFDNEFNFADELDSSFEVVKVKLERKVLKSDALPEQGLPGIPAKSYDIVVPEDASIHEKNSMVIDHLIEIDWIQKLK